ncbi:MAG: molybdopterin-dependent oxidoreductase, partial [Candidatus Aureabacteria bacterium]|nr:molybdopterin-dependent oxidoreductase [Candidatus Auribacterota bacterium]
FWHDTLLYTRIHSFRHLSAGKEDDLGGRLLTRRMFFSALGGGAVALLWYALKGRGRGMMTPDSGTGKWELRVPPGQHWVDELVEYSAGGRPVIEESSWRLSIDGLVEQPLDYTHAGFQKLPHVEVVRDFHCVTTWSVRDCRWRGVLMRDLLAMARPKPEAAHLLIECYGGYSTNFPLASALAPDVILADSLNGKPLAHRFGGPLRLVVPKLYAYKSAKWVTRVTLLAGERLGYWERYGYSNQADPWKEQRWTRDDRV